MNVLSEIWRSIEWRWSVLKLTTGLKVRNRLKRQSVLDPRGPVVTLTTHGKRVDTVHLTIESIARGRLRPRRLVLWVCDPVVVNAPPEALRRLVARGLEVRLTDDLGPHTKYWPSLSLSELSQVPLVTADDDVVYPRDWLSGLWAEHLRTPSHVVAYRARVIACTPHEISPYRNWQPCRSTQPCVRHFVTGVSGAIYPPSFLAELQRAGDQFMALCPRADDIWLNAMALRTGHLVRQISTVPMEFPTVPGTQEQALMHDNVGRGGNDRQVKAVYSAQDIRMLNVC